MITDDQMNKAFKFSRLSNVRRLYQENPDSYFCPTCGTLSKKFCSGGVGKKRKNAKCPTCGSLERHRLFWLYFMNMVWIDLPKGKKNLLHVAPEPFLKDLLGDHPELNYISGDLMMPETMIKIDLTNIPVWDNQFDVIICLHILEHINNDTLAMREMYRITKPGGYLLVMVPIYGQTTHEDISITTSEERLKYFGQEDHVRKYGMDIVRRMEKVGFTVSEWPDETIFKDLLSFIACGSRLVFAASKRIV